MKQTLSPILFLFLIEVLVLRPHTAGAAEDKLAGVTEEEKLDLKTRVRLLEGHLRDFERRYDSQVFAMENRLKDLERQMEKPAGKESKK